MSRKVILKVIQLFGSLKSILYAHDQSASKSLISFRTTESEFHGFHDRCVCEREVDLHFDFFLFMNSLSTVPSSHLTFLFCLGFRSFSTTGTSLWNYSLYMIKDLGLLFQSALPNFYPFIDSQTKNIYNIYHLSNNAVLNLLIDMAN